MSSLEIRKNMISAVGGSWKSLLQSRALARGPRGPRGPRSISSKNHFPVERPGPAGRRGL